MKNSILLIVSWVVFVEIDLRLPRSRKASKAYPPAEGSPVGWNSVLHPLLHSIYKVVPSLTHRCICRIWYLLHPLSARAHAPFDLCYEVTCPKSTKKYLSTSCSTTLLRYRKAYLLNFELIGIV